MPSMVPDRRWGRAAQVAAQLSQNHPRATAPGGQRRGQTRHTTTRDEHVAVDVLMHVPVTVLLTRRRTQTAGLANKVLVPHPCPCRPHEGLVVEAGRKQRCEPAVDAQQVFAGARPGIDTLADQTLVQLNLGHLGVRDGPGTRLQLHQRGRLFDATGHHRTRPVVLPRARQDGLAGGQHRRGQGVPGEAMVAAPVETKLNGA